MAACYICPYLLDIRITSSIWVPLGHEWQVSYKYTSFQIFVTYLTTSESGNPHVRWQMTNLLSQTLWEIPRVMRVCWREQVAPTKIIFLNRFFQRVKIKSDIRTIFLEHFQTVPNFSTFQFGFKSETPICLEFCFESLINLEKWFKLSKYDWGFGLVAITAIEKYFFNFYVR